MRARHVMSAVALVALAGCSSSPAPADPAADTVKVLESAAAAQAALPLCSDVFVPGKPVDEKLALAGCKSKRGVFQSVAFFECQDGGILFQIDASTGAPNGYGFGGKPYQAVEGDSAADKGYKKAYHACQSNEPAVARTDRSSTVTEGQPAVEPVTTTSSSTVGQADTGRAVAETTAQEPAADQPETEPTTEEVPVPGGEWRLHPSPSPSPTEDQF